MSKQDTEFPDLSFTDQLLQDRDDGLPVGKILNIPSTQWTFPEDLALIGKLIKVDEITMRQAQDKGFEEQTAAKRKFKIYIFEHYETKMFHSLAGSCLDQENMELERYYMIDRPIETDFNPSGGGAKRRYKDFRIEDITDRVLEDIKRKNKTV